MKNAPLYRRILAVVLTAAMLFSLLVPAASAESKAASQVEELELVPVDPGTLESLKVKFASEDTSVNQADHKMTDVVRVSIVLDSASTLEAGFNPEGIAKNASAKAYREGLRAEQEAMTAKIEKAIGGKLDVQWNLTLAANIISANVLYGQIDAIKALSGVRAVFLENRYEPQKAEPAADEPNNGSASVMIGSNISWAAGYTGAGSKLAIIDTGIDVEHQSFSGEGLEYALAQNAEEKGLSYEEYVASLNLLTAESIDAVKDQLNANIGSGESVHISTKIGYGYNYVDKNFNVTHMEDSQGEHGSHVEGISAANRFIKVDGEFKPALEAVGTQGVAPDAQIVTMKVFGKGGGAYDSDYMVAIEDAIILGCDSANLSLGSGSAGFSFSSGYESIMNELVENGMVCSMSIGNSYSWYNTPKNLPYGYLYADDASFDTGGSPGSFTNSLAVASVDNAGQTGTPMLFGDRTVFFNETSGYGNQPIATLAGQELEYVLIDSVGVDDNGHVGQAGDDFLALGSEVLTGKVAMCFRGTSSFFAKANAAVAQGAIAVIIINNQPGAINMNLTGYNYTAPAVSILQADGLAIMADSEKVTTDDGLEYYTGTMSVSETLQVYAPDPSDTVTVSEFSSWGVPGTLVLKPELLAPGGSIYSVWGANNGADAPTQEHDGYELMSGTSMASPQVNGMAGVLGQYIRDNNLCEKTGLSQRQLINSLLMSTAHPVYDDANDGSYWPVIEVGAGLANVGDAVSAKSYILMDEDSTMFPDSAKDGKVKAELGDDPDRTGEYTYSFTVYPLEGKKEFTLRTDIFVQWLAGNGGYGMLQDYATILIGSEAAYEINGEIYEDTYPFEADVNMDGETNAADAQAILDHLTGAEAEDAKFDAEAADIDGDGKITSYDAKLLLEAAATPTIEVTEPTHVTVHLKLDEADKNYLLNYFTNGFYVQGYTYIDPVADEEGALDVVHSIPILGFCGSWTDPAMLDRTSAIDNAYGTGKLAYVAASNNINYLTLKDAEGNSAVYMGNPFTVEDVFPAEKLAMNSEATVVSYNYLNIRNIATLGFAVQDEEGKVIFSMATPASKNGAYYYVNGGAWQNYNPATYNVGKKLSAAGVAEGDKVTVGFYALPEYYGVLNAKNNGEVATSGSLDNDGFKAILESGVVGDGAAIKYTVTIDDTAPEVLGAFRDLITGNITVKAKDNQYIAYVGVMNGSGSKEFFAAVPDQSEPGVEIEVPLDLEGIQLPSEVTLLVGDYAGNKAAFKVSLGSSEQDSESLMLGFVTDQTTAAPGSGNRMWEIDKDALWYNYSAGTYEGLNVYANIDVAVRAAEYVDGYVFMAATDGWFYAAELNAMDEAARVGKFSDKVDEIYDMAYNYKDKTMYALGSDNVIYAMDLITGKLTPVYAVILSGATGSNAVANKLAIDDNNVFYIGAYGSTSNAKVYKFIPAEPEESGEEESEFGELVYGFGFDTDPAEEGWTFIDLDGDGRNWTVDSSSPNDGTQCIRSASYESGAAFEPDNWAVSPAIDLSGYDEATFGIYAKNYMSSFPETLALYAGTSADPAEMVQVKADFQPDTVWTQYTADLSEFAGEAEVYVAVRHYNSYDEFRVYADTAEVFGKVNEAPVEEPEPEAVEITAEEIGTMGVYNYNNGGAFAWDHENGILYLASNYNATQDYDHYLWIINTSTGKAARANETQGTALSSGNPSARLYGCVNGLFIVPGHTSVIQPAEEPTDLIVEPEEVTLMKGQSADLTVAVFPWTLKDKDVTFESADAAIASVNEKGTITGVAVGETDIIVSTVAEPVLSAQVHVTVVEPPVAELRGVIWDENGKGQASVFMTNDTENWEALAVVGQLRWGALIDDMVYGSTDDTMFGFDADTYEVETYGGIVSMWIPSDATELPEDLADAFADMGYAVGRVLGPNNNGTYLSMLDPEEGSILYFDLSDYAFGSDPMATITYAGRGVYDDGESVDENGACFYVMSESGMLWLFTMNHEGSVMWEEIGETGIDLGGVSDSTNSIWASMIYDEETEYLFLSLYKDGDYAYLYAIDPADPACNAQVGDFKADVWPVTGLYQYTPGTDLVLRVKPTDVTIFEGETAEVNIKVKLGETNEYTAEVADPSICSFEDGVITGLKAGETTITITTVDTNEAGEHLSETINVKVKGFKSVDLFVHGQVTDAKGTRFTKISLDGAVVSSNGTDAPGNVSSGSRTGDIYFAGMGTSYKILDAETFEVTNAWNGVDSATYSSYPAMDVANFPAFEASDGSVDDHRMLFTTSINWLVKPDYYGWNLSSFIADMAGVCFGGIVEDGGSELYLYYILGADGTLYQLGIDYVAGVRTDVTPILDTGIVLADQNDASMAFIATAKVAADGSVTGEYENAGIAIADNGSKKLWYIDFLAEEEDDVVGLIGFVDAENVSGLYGTFDSLAAVGDVEPVEPEPQPGDITGDLIQGFYFEEEPTDWTFVDSDGDGYTWTWNQNAASWWSNTPDLGSMTYEGTGSILTASFINTVGVLYPDNWAVSPAIDLSEAGEDAIVSLYAAGLDASYANEPFAIYAGTSSDPAQMTQISQKFISTADWTQYTGSLANFVGEEEVYIALRHYDISDMYILQVDQVEILDNLSEAPEPGPGPEPQPGDAAYTWDFETDPAAAGWTFLDSDNDGFNWYWHVNTGTGNHTTHSGDGLICSASYDNDSYTALTPNNWAISPAFDLSEVETSATLSIWAMGQDPSYASEKFALYAGTSANPASMTKISSDFTATGSYANYMADLSAFLGESEVYVAIRHYNVSDMFILNVDDVEILVASPESGNARKDAPAPAASSEAVAPAFIKSDLNLGFARLDRAASDAVEMAKLGETANAVVGGTNVLRAQTFTGAKRELADETTAADGEVKIVLTDDENVTNGLYEITYDPAVLTFVDAISTLEHFSVFQCMMEELGTPATPDDPGSAGRIIGVIRFAFASVEEIEAESVLATLNFTYEDESIDTVVTVNVLERSDNVAVEEELEIPIKVEEHDCPCYMFEDMPEYGTIEHAAIDWAFTHDPQITDGMDDTHFMPDFIVNRGQAVTFLWRASGKPAPAGTTPFTDLDQDWYMDPVAWAFNADPQITDGMTDTTFEPDTSLNRAMMLTFLYRQQGKPAIEESDAFADVPEWYRDAMIWALQNGIIDEETQWDEDCPRVDVVVYLFRVYEPEAAAAFNGE